MSASSAAGHGVPLEEFPALSAWSQFRHAFTGRVAGLDVATDRARALTLLDQHHVAARKWLGLGERHFVFAQQVHGNAVAVVDAGTPVPVAQVDGLITNDPQVCLGTYVADCGPIYLVDPIRQVVALLHSGRKGTELGIAGVAIARMVREFGCAPADLIAQLGPCIRPPHYEVDFAAEILAQCRAAGLTQVHDCGICTAAEPERYYSYRRELGKTGRHLALLALL